MFKLEPITTTNILSILQILVVIVGFYFSWRSLQASGESLKTSWNSLQASLNALSLGTKNAQAQLFNQMVLQARDLQYKFMDIYYPETTSENLAKRQDIYTGTVIGYYASCFELRSVLTLPAQIEKLLDAEIRHLMTQKPFRDKWEDVKSLHSNEFITYVNSKRGV